MLSSGVVVKWGRSKPDVRSNAIKWGCGGVLAVVYGARTLGEGK